MGRLNQLLLTCIVAVLVCLTSSVGLAQSNTDTGTQGQRAPRRQRGNFDPAQFRQRMMDRLRQRLEITDDAEWKAVEPLIQAVFDARAAVGTAGRGGFGRGGRSQRDGNPTPTASAQRPDGARENPAAEELQKAIDSKASPAEMKSALAKYNDYHKAKLAELEKARDALRAVLTSRQEAIATLSGLL